ncbi:hypothetical protein ACFLYO_00280 [Chloroflexota bacterium]
MMKPKLRLTLDQPATYQIKVPGCVDASWLDRVGEVDVVTRQADDGSMTTTLTGLVADQAALHGLLRWLYSLGLPLISVIWMESEI